MLEHSQFSRGLSRVLSRDNLLQGSGVHTEQQKCYTNLYTDIQNCKTLNTICSIQSSCLVVSDSLLPHGLQHAAGLPVHHQLPELTQTHVH